MPGEGKKTDLRTSKERQRRLPDFPAIRHEMRHWSALLCAELEGWPQVSHKPMFGFTSYYRKGRIFAALPKTRGLYNDSSFLIKFDPRKPALRTRAGRDPRMSTNGRAPGKGWYSFELQTGSDLRDALYWLNQAFEAVATEAAAGDRSP